MLSWQIWRLATLRVAASTTESLESKIIRLFFQEVGMVLDLELNKVRFVCATEFTLEKFAPYSKRFVQELRFLTQIPDLGFSFEVVSAQELEQLHLKGLLPDASCLTDASLQPTPEEELMLRSLPKVRNLRGFTAENSADDMTQLDAVSVFNQPVAASCAAVIAHGTDPEQAEAKPVTVLSKDDCEQKLLTGNIKDCLCELLHVVPADNREIAVYTKFDSSAAQSVECNWIQSVHNSANTDLDGQSLKSKQDVETSGSGVVQTTDVVVAGDPVSVSDTPTSLSSSDSFSISHSESEELTKMQLHEGGKPKGSEQDGAVQDLSVTRPNNISSQSSDTHSSSHSAVLMQMDFEHMDHQALEQLAQDFDISLVQDVVEHSRSLLALSKNCKDALATAEPGASKVNLEFVSAVSSNALMQILSLIMTESDNECVIANLDSELKTLKDAKDAIAAIVAVTDKAAKVAEAAYLKAKNEANEADAANNHPAVSEPATAAVVPAEKEEAREPVVAAESNVKAKTIESEPATIKAENETRAPVAVATGEPVTAAVVSAEKERQECATVSTAVVPVAQESSAATKIANDTDKTVAGSASGAVKANGIVTDLSVFDLANKESANRSESNTFNVINSAAIGSNVANVANVQSGSSSFGDTQLAVLLSNSLAAKNCSLPAVSENCKINDKYVDQCFLHRNEQGIKYEQQPADEPLDVVSVSDQNQTAVLDVKLGALADVTGDQVAFAGGATNKADVLIAGASLSVGCVSNGLDYFNRADTGVEKAEYAEPSKDQDQSGTAIVEQLNGCEKSAQQVTAHLESATRINVSQFDQYTSVPFTGGVESGDTTAAADDSAINVDEADEHSFTLYCDNGLYEDYTKDPDDFENEYDFPETDTHADIDPIEGYKAVRFKPNLDKEHDLGSIQLAAVPVSSADQKIKVNSVSESTSVSEKVESNAQPAQEKVLSQVKVVVEPAVPDVQKDKFDSRTEDEKERFSELYNDGSRLLSEEEIAEIREEISFSQLCFNSSLIDIPNKLECPYPFELLEPDPVIAQKYLSDSKEQNSLSPSEDELPVDERHGISEEEMKQIHEDMSFSELYFHSLLVDIPGDNDKKYPYSSCDLTEYTLEEVGAMNRAQIEYDSREEAFYNLIISLGHKVWQWYEQEMPDCEEQQEYCPDQQRAPELWEDSDFQPSCGHNNGSMSAPEQQLMNYEPEQYNASQPSWELSRSYKAWNQNNGSMSAPVQQPMNYAPQNQVPPQQAVEQNYGNGPEPVQQNAQQSWEQSRSQAVCGQNNGSMSAPVLQPMNCEPQNQVPPQQAVEQNYGNGSVYKQQNALQSWEQSGYQAACAQNNDSMSVPEQQSLNHELQEQVPPQQAVEQNYGNGNDPEPVQQNASQSVEQSGSQTACVQNNDSMYAPEQQSLNHEPQEQGYAESDSYVGNEYPLEQQLNNSSDNDSSSKYKFPKPISSKILFPNGREWGAGAAIKQDSAEIEQYQVLAPVAAKVPTVVDARNTGVTVKRNSSRPNDSFISRTLNNEIVDHSYITTILDRDRSAAAVVNLQQEEKANIAYISQSGKNINYTDVILLWLGACPDAFKHLIKVNGNYKFTLDQCEDFCIRMKELHDAEQFVKNDQVEGQYDDSSFGLKVSRFNPAQFQQKYKEDVLNSGIVPKEENIDPTVVLDDFVLNDENTSLAYMVQDVVQFPGTNKHKQFFLYGKSGVGKTHMLNAMFNAIKFFHPKLNVALINADKFSWKFIASLKNSNIRHFSTDQVFFQKAFMAYDVLIFDGIQNLRTKPQSLKVFYEVISEFSRKPDSQLILCANCEPAAFKEPKGRDRDHKLDANFYNQLVNQLSSGVTCELFMPKGKHLRTMIARMCAKLNMCLSEDIIDYIVLNIGSSLNKVQGAIRTISSSNKFTRERLSFDDTVKSLQFLVEEHKSNVSKYSINDVMKAAADEFQVSVSDIRSNRKTRHISAARGLALLIIRDALPNMSLNDVAHAFAKDHSSVHEAIVRMRERLQTDVVLTERTHNILKRMMSAKGVTLQS